MYLMRYFMLGSYKDMELNFVNDDTMLSTLGAAGNFAGSFGKMFWSSIMDFVDFKKLMAAILLV